MTGGAPRATARARAKPRREERLTLFQKAGARAPEEGQRGGGGRKQAVLELEVLPTDDTSPKRGPGWWSSRVWLYFLFFLQLGD